MKVSEVMSKNVSTCEPSAALTDAAKMMLDEDCGAIPVVGEGKVIGIITDRDIVVRAVAKGKNPSDLKVSDCMSKSVSTVKADADLNECTDIMEREQVRRIPVVDKGGKVIGIVAQADVARKATAKETAELVKDVSK